MSLKPATPLKPALPPVTSSPQLLVPSLPAQTPAQLAPIPVVSVKLTTPQAKPAAAPVAPKANPFDNTRKPNSPAVKKETPATEEPPLVLPEAGDASVDVDPAPVPLPPSE